MSQQDTSGGGAVEKAFDTFAAIFPQWLDYKRGYDPNQVYPYQLQQQGYLFAPVNNNGASLAQSQALFGAGPIGALPVGTVVLLAVGAFLVWKYA